MNRKETGLSGDTLSEKVVAPGEAERRIWSSALEDVFEDPKRLIFMRTSCVDVFDVVGGRGLLKRGLNDEAMELSLSFDERRLHGPRMRFIFLDGIVDDQTFLPITSSLARRVFDTYKINRRFSDYCKKQRGPGRALHYKDSSDEVYRHEIWYSAVLRYPASNHANVNKQGDASRSVIDWHRFCLWADYDSNQESTFFIWRCPLYVKERFFSVYADTAAAQLQQHPMVAHLFFAEHILLHNHDFLTFFSEPIYAEEAGGQGSLADTSVYTKRAKSFLRLARQVRQAGTDYYILQMMIERLVSESLWLTESALCPGRNSAFPGRALELQDQIDTGLAQLREEVKLIEVYNNLFVERSSLGVNECFAMVNQRDSELNVHMAAESTTIARASHQDARSLRIIQLMSMTFLPASFVSGIFGMGFFTTQGDATNPVFVVSGKWWIYLAVAVPLTLAILILVAMYQARNAEKSAEKIRRESQTSMSGLGSPKRD